MFGFYHRIRLCSRGFVITDVRKKNRDVKNAVLLYHVLLAIRFNV